MPITGAGGADDGGEGVGGGEQEGRGGQHGGHGDGALVRAAGGVHHRHAFQWRVCQ